MSAKTRAKGHLRNDHYHGEFYAKHLSEAVRRLRKAGRDPERLRVRSYTRAKHKRTGVVRDRNGLVEVFVSEGIVRFSAA